MKGRSRLGRFVRGHTLVWPDAPRPPNSGRFQRGHGGIGAAKRRKPGDTYTDRHGEVYIAVAEANPYFPHRPHTFRPRRLVNWEAAHGEVPPGCVVMRMSRDPADDSLRNLVLVRRGTLLLLNSGRWARPYQQWKDLPDDPELRLMAVAAAALRAGAPYICLPGAINRPSG